MTVVTVQVTEWTTALTGLTIASELSRADRKNPAPGGVFLFNDLPANVLAGLQRDDLAIA